MDARGNTIRRVEQLVRPDQPISIELVSTVHVDASGPVDALASPAQLRAWFYANRRRIPVGAADPGAAHLVALRALREVLRSVFGARVADEVPPSSVVEDLNRASRLALGFLELEWAGDGPTAVARSTGAGGDRLLAALACDAIEVLTGAGHQELRACEAPGCVLFFVRTHPRQAWCSPACGNRARVARHYRKVRGSR